MKNLSDKQILSLCDLYGMQARLARQKFEGLLPEVFRRGLYKKDFESIHHFAAVKAGLSKDRVNRILQLERKFAEMPALQKVLVNGEVSVNKLARVASVATKENQEDLAEKTKLLSKHALETIVRDKKLNGSPKPLLAVPGHRIELSDEVHEKLYELQQRGLDVNKILLELLGNREKEIQEEKRKMSEKPGKSRHIPAKIKKILLKEYGSKCSSPGCNKESVQIHHIKKYSTHQNHDPINLIPFCKSHHEIAHHRDPIHQKVRIRCGYG